MIPNLQYSETNHNVPNVTANFLTMKDILLDNSLNKQNLSSVHTKLILTCKMITITAVKY